MKSLSTYSTFRAGLTLMILLMLSMLTASAQSISKNDIQETFNFVAGTQTFSIATATIPDGSTCSWTVDGNEVTTGLSDDGKTVTLNLTNKIRKATLTITPAEGSNQTIEFDIVPKTYGMDYNGQRFYADKFAGGSGKVDDPYIISNDMELALLAHNVTYATNGEQPIDRDMVYSGVYFKLSQDIDLSRGQWMPIGTCVPTNAHFFAGQFDGCGYAVRNMHIYWYNDSIIEFSWGLFSRLKGVGSSKLEQFATVTNLVIEDACVEKKPNYAPGNKVLKIGILAGDLTENAEISNIIIRNGKITDEGESYNKAGNFRVGGIVGYLDNNKVFRIYNISADTEVNCLVHATVSDTKSTISGGFGCISRVSTTNRYAIGPTNIYVHGKGVTTHDKCRRGSVIAFYSDSYSFSGEQQKTLYYSSENKQKGNNSANQGSLIEDKDKSTFGKTFADQCNNFNADKGDKMTWSYFEGNNSFSYSTLMLKMVRGTEDVLHVEKADGTVSTDNYYWYVSSFADGSDETPLSTKPCPNVVLPRKTYNQYVWAEIPSDNIRTSIMMVEPIEVTAKLQSGTNPGEYVVLVENSTQQSNDELGLTITYAWYENEGETPVQTGTNNTFVCPEGSTANYRCHVTVQTGTLTLCDEWFKTQAVVYLCPSDANTTDEDTRIIDPTWGYSPEKPMKTWRGAYSKLLNGLSWYDNVIVLMGKSPRELTSHATDGFCITSNYRRSIKSLGYDEWYRVSSTTPLAKNATITGQWDGTDYGGIIEISGASDGLPIWGDTRFENITIDRGPTYIGDYYKAIYCQYHNLEMGKGIKMTGFTTYLTGYGSIDGAVTTPVNIFGGLNNDARFYPLSTPQKIDEFNNSMPYGKEGFTITVKSGYYACISPGGRQVESNNLTGVMGTATQPLKCTINIDIDRDWNDQHKKTFVDGLEYSESHYDAGIVLAGSHEGAMYADVDINILSGKIARVANGTLGSQNEFTFRYDEQEYKVPDNSYMGRANILLDPAKSENNKAADINSRIIVTEMYGGGTGRGHKQDVRVNNPFYGYSTIIINGGTFKILPEDNGKANEIKCGIFGAGAGGMNGIGNDQNHTPDESIPYWNDTEDVMLYGEYSEAKDRLIKYHCYNAQDGTYTDVDPLETSSKIIINGGVFGDKKGYIDGIYAGGSGYMSKGLWTERTSVPNRCGGNMYGKQGSENPVASLTINGGKFYCKNGVFAGGRGTDYYYSIDPYGATPKEKTGDTGTDGTEGDTGTDGETGADGASEADEVKEKPADYDALGQIYGNVELNINGGDFYCPVFGGGYGVADAQLYGTDNRENRHTLTKMALITGKSTMTILGGTFYDNIYGGGDMALIVNQGADAVNVTIGDSADVRGAVFAGGEGRIKRVDEPYKRDNDDYTDDPVNVGKVIGNTNLRFTGSTQAQPYVYGNIFGGGNKSQVDGNTSIYVTALNYGGEIFGGGNGLLDEKDGTVRNTANISGNTSVKLIQDPNAIDADEVEENNTNLINVVWDKMWKEGQEGQEGHFCTWQEDKSLFFIDEKCKYVVAHNIFGGGNVACVVSGKASLQIEKGVTPFSLLQTPEWKKSYTDDEYPHFYVFGGGYGIHTIVGSTDVNVNVEGDYGIYDTDVDDDIDQLSEDGDNPVYSDATASSGKKGRKGRKSKKAQTESSENSAKAEGDVVDVFDNSKGIPNFTILGVVGGGYSGVVTDSTQVVIDGKTFLHRVYGGGFGDHETEKNDTSGVVKGKTSVYIRGAKTYGDVFGGGAGVAPRWINGEQVHFTNVARVWGTTSVYVSDDANIYGHVYGGGDMANVGKYQENTDYTSAPKSESTLDENNHGAATKYTASNYRTYVDITGGNVYGEVYGGGKGLTRANATEYYKVGRVNGNTLVHVADSIPGKKGNNANKEKPYLWNRIYGGCAYGTVDGNTLVHIEGGMLGLNIFGGGYGDVEINDDDKDDGYLSGESTSMNVLSQVMGKRDTERTGSYANILGNTKVQIDGGSWLWNQRADINGNKTMWTASNSDTEKVCANYSEFMTLMFAMQYPDQADPDDIAKLQEIIQRISTDKSTQEFFDVENLSFHKNHNIFGGGNRACIVGSYEAGTDSPKSGTGDAVVEINHSPLTDILDPKGNSISLLDCTTLQGFCWVLSNDDKSHPQFSVFGAGYGCNTKVGNTRVYVRPGVITNADGTEPREIHGKKFRYLSQSIDAREYAKVESRLMEDFQKVLPEDKKQLYGSSTGGNSDGTDDDTNTYKRYRASRMAWQLGVPNSTFYEVYGGGFSGYVVGNTYVEADCQLACRNVYGAGRGYMPYGDIDETVDYDFGSIGGKSKVFIKSGFIIGNVYGGGAGVESVRSKDGKMYDFPHIARVSKGTEVNIYGDYIDRDNVEIDRTMIFGSVYGGGDVANVGTDDMKAEAKQFGHDIYVSAPVYTSMVNIRGGSIYSYVFAGGNGRKKSECADYTKLGGVYGNTVLIVDRPAEGMRYPYLDSNDNPLDPSSPQYMKHPDDEVNKAQRPVMLCRIYGGCQNGTVYGNTIVAINDGQLGQNIFGGGWGSCDTLMVDNQKVLDLTSANVTGNTNMIVVGGDVLLTSYWNTNTRFWNPAESMGGKLYSPQYDPLNRKFYINHNIYGGGNVACVVGERDSSGKLVGESGNTYLTMVKGLLYGTTKVRSGQPAKDYNFFESDEWKQVYEKVGSPHFAVFGGGYGAYTSILGDTHVNIQMQGRGSIDHFDLDEQNPHKHFISGYSVMDIVGGGFSGKVEGNTNIIGDGGVFCRRVFGGGFLNSVKSTYVNIEAIDCHDVFGGGLMGDVLESTNVRIGNEEAKGSTLGFTNADIYIHGNVYGANDVSGFVNVTLNSEGFFADNGGTGTNIVIRGGTIFGNVYGAGNGDYLYALDRQGHTQVTVNEYYPINYGAPDSETVPLVYTVPMRNNMPSYKAASNAAKIVNINSWRPLTNKVNITLRGNSETDTLVIKGDVYGGGNSATVLQVQSRDTKAGNTEGSVKLDIGSNVNIGRVFMGSDGDALFTASKDNNFMNNFQKLNADIDDYTKSLDLSDTIDWVNDPANKGISTLYLPVQNKQRPMVYPHLLDLYFQPVETNIQGELLWNGSEVGEGLTNCTISEFFCGGNRGNMNVYPDENGKVFSYTFPEGLTITKQIVGGCNNANYYYTENVRHEGGYLLGLAHSQEPMIELIVKNEFQPREKNGAYQRGNVYGGCYQSGTVRGDISINLQSDMLKGKSKTKLERSNELIGSDPDYSTLNVYGAGYGMESYVYGNTYIKVAEGLACEAPTTNDSKMFNPSGTSANFVYGGGQQGNVIGMTCVDVFNGHIFKAATGGSYSGYVWGSTVVKVGYPEYYRVHTHNYQSGRYILNRVDKNNQYIDREGNTENGAVRSDLASETIKQSINLVTDDIVSQAVYNDICGKYNPVDGSITPITDANKGDYFMKVPAEEPAIGWDNINIHIGEALYGGGYSVGQGTSVMANSATVLKYTKEYNIDEAFMTHDKHIEELMGLPGSTTAGFGGNTTILVRDRTSVPDDSKDTDRDHITISHQEMKKVDLPKGTDLFGYYYLDGDGNYRYISLHDTYFYGTKHPKGQNENVYRYDSEGGIFGDGHQSYAQGFRSADLTGYGFASSTVTKAKVINTFQRLDILRLEDNCFNVLGARDYATNTTNMTPYSIARVGEIQMYADSIKYDAGGTLMGKGAPRSRNYMGLSNNIHYVGTINSNVSFDKDVWHNGNGSVASDGKSYKDVKQKYIDDYSTDGNVSEFQKRNDGTAKNMIGIASGYALKIQGVQQTYKNNKVVDSLYYGPVYGVIEMYLINSRSDEGGGYVYADNVHKRAQGDSHPVDFLETTGNFVFPYTPQLGHYIVDDCFPTSYLNIKDKDNPDDKEDVHYWYVTGFNYYYNVHLTGYTYKDHLTFNSDNSDGLTVLSGLKGGQQVNIANWRMRSGHPEDEKEYSCDLEKRNYLPAGTEGNVDVDGKDVSGCYQLYVGASASKTFVDPTLETEQSQKGFAALLPMDGNTYSGLEAINALLPSGLQDDAKIAFQLRDNVNNSTSDYFNSHLSRKCQATLVMKAPAYQKFYGEGDAGNRQVISKVSADMFFTKNTEGEYVGVAPESKLDSQTDYYIRNGIDEEFFLVNKDSIFTKSADESETYTKVEFDDVEVGKTYFCSVPREYTYTIYLTIEYVQGPTIEGNITIENCALPGEMIRLKKNNVNIKADQSFSANGYYWRIGKCKKDDKGNLSFADETKWDVGTTAPGYDSYKQGNKQGTGVFGDCVYNETYDYLEIPAYYYMNGYAVQLGVTMNGLDQIFPVDLLPSDTLVVHNYHRMLPGQKGVDLHLAQAVARANGDKSFAEPRIYIVTRDELVAFVNFVDTIGTGVRDENGGIVEEYVSLGARRDERMDKWVPDLYKVPRYGACAQFVLQNDLDISSLYDGKSPAQFAGTIHGNGHVIRGLAPGKFLFNSITGHVYNLGLASGRISNMRSVYGKQPNYHCCYEYSPSVTPTGLPTNAPLVYHLDGTVDKGYTHDDFRSGRVAYDLNEYYLRARYSHDPSNADDMAALKYVYDYYANGDYQYAHRSDDVTGRVTGFTYLRTGQGSDYPNYGNAETRHDQSHTIDQARVKQEAPLVYEPLFNDNRDATSDELINDFLFWGQSLQGTPADYPSTIGYRQYTDLVFVRYVDHMVNRVYRTAAYYGNTQLDALHYNAYDSNGSSMDTYVHDTKTTAVDFTCTHDLSQALGFTEETPEAKAIFYAPVADNATVFHALRAKDGVTKNLLVYTPADKADVETDVYSMAEDALSYDEATQESSIVGHHIHADADAFTAPYLHLVERTPDGQNSEGESCRNNDFCAPLPFSVSNRAWYTRKPMYYADTKNLGAWEGLCLPFTVDKVEASLNGEITHFYGTPSEEEIDDPFQNTHTLHHEYWLRGLVSVGQDSEGRAAATFQRPSETGFTPTSADGTSLCESVSYVYENPFFVDTYEHLLYNKTDNPYYAEPHTYDDYQLQIADVPYLVRFPGARYYEFDLSSNFYNSIVNGREDEQTITFNAYGKDNAAIHIGVTSDDGMTTTVDGYTHHGAFAAINVEEQSVYGMNAQGNAFDDASSLSAVMPFRTYMAVATTRQKAQSAASARDDSAYPPSTIVIAEPAGIDTITPEVADDEEDADATDYLKIRSIGQHRVSVESSQSMTLRVYTPAGQLYRTLAVEPGTAVYSGFYPGIYIFGKIKVAVE